MRIRDSRACPRMGVPLWVARGARSASEDSAGDLTVVAAPSDGDGGSNKTGLTSD